MCVRSSNIYLLCFFWEGGEGETVDMLYQSAGSSPIHWSIVNAQLEILRVLAPLVPDDVLLQPDGSGATPLDLAELNENAGECAGYIYGVLTIRERDRGREAGDHEGAEGLEEMMKETMLNTDGEREKTPTPAESPKRVVDEPER